MNKTSAEIIGNSTVLSSDLYQYTMGATWYDKKREQEMGIFNVLFRKAPDNNGWAIVCGVEQVIEMIQLLNTEDNSGARKEFFEKILPSENGKSNKYSEYLTTMRFTGSIYAMTDGTIAFPNEVLLKVVAPIIEGQVLETPILSILNGQMGQATAASRVCRSAGPIPVMSFGSRRAHSIMSAVYGDRAAFIGGCVSVSNILANEIWGIPVNGTMAHSFIQSYPLTVEGEYQAFMDYCTTPMHKNFIMLADTLDFVNSGVYNAIRAWKACGLTNEGILRWEYILGVRSDSGDPVYNTKFAKEVFRKNGYPDAKVVLTNGLDENTITIIRRELDEAGVKADSLGVGDRIATSKFNPCFGGVYKLAEVNGNPTLKVSLDAIKVTNPGNQYVLRITGNNGKFIADIIGLEGDDTYKKLMGNEEVTIRSEVDKFKTTTLKSGAYTIKNLLIPVVVHGKVPGYAMEENHPLKARKRLEKELTGLSQEQKRLIDPYEYKVDISNELYDLKMQTLYNIKDRVAEFDWESHGIIL